MKTEIKHISISGYCPYLDDEYHIIASYQKIQPMGQPQIFGRYVGAKCDIRHKCKIKDCPLFAEAEARTLW